MSRYVLFILTGAMFAYQPTLAGQLLVLRPAKAQDWSRLYDVGSDPQVWADHPNSDRYIEDNFRAYLAEGLASGGAWVATTADAGQIVGWSRYSSQFVEADEIEIGWTFLARTCWGGLYNMEMKQLMLRHAFRFVDKVLFRIAASNLRSRRATEKIGARLVVDRRAPSGAKGAVPYVFYVMNRLEFAGRP